MVSRKAVLAHCRALTAACHYSEGDVMICVVDCRREAGLWHAALAVSSFILILLFLSDYLIYHHALLFVLPQSVFNGMHVVFVPFNVLQMDPGSWIRMVTKYRGKIHFI